MRHRQLRTQLSRNASHRKALFSNLVKNLIEHERIHTTLNYAKVSSQFADKMITLAKKGDVHARRQAYNFLQNRDLVKKLFHDIGPRFTERNGGYTRIIRLSKRAGDNNQLAMIEFVTKSETKEEAVKPLETEAKDSPIENQAQVSPEPEKSQETESIEENQSSKDPE